MAVTWSTAHVSYATLDGPATTVTVAPVVCGHGTSPLSGIVGENGAHLAVAVTEDVLTGVWVTNYPLLVGGPLWLPPGYTLPSVNSATEMRQ